MYIYNTTFFERSTGETLYKVLEVQKTSTVEEIKQSYKKVSYIKLY